MRRGSVYENIISTWKSIRKHIGQETSCTKTCNAAQTFCKTQILYTKTYIITMFFLRKRTNIYKSIRKSISKEAISKKTIFQLENVFESVYIKRPTVRTCSTSQACSETQIFYTKKFKHFQIYTKMYKGRGRVYENIISTWKSIRKHRGQETSCTKTCNASQACSIQKHLLYENV